MERVEGLRPRLEQDGDEVDHGIRSGDGGAHALGIAEIGLNQLHLPDIAHHLEVEARMGAAHGHAHAEAPLDELAHDIAPDESGAAEDGDEFGRERVCHGRGL